MLPTATLTLLLSALVGSSADPAADYQWLKNYTHSILLRCRLNASDGTVLYSPNQCNASGCVYKGQWMRDSFYGFSSGWQQIPDAREALAAAAWMLRHTQPKTNYMPQCVAPDDVATYGQHGAPTTLDAGAFAGLMLAFFATGAGSAAQGGGLDFLRAHGSAVALGMAATPMRDGLPWSDPARPCVGYGFSDTIEKTNNELYSSILFWDASRKLSAAFLLAGNESMAERFEGYASRVEARFSTAFWNERIGMFMADTGIESDRIDVWGSAYAALTGLALPVQAQRVARFLASNASNIFYKGQTRELPQPHLWAKEFPGTRKKYGYQNGGYWGTPNHHVLVLLGKHQYRALACDVLAQAIDNYRSHGAYEWIARGATVGSGAPLYVATAANTLKAAEELACWKRA